MRACPLSFLLLACGLSAASRADAAPSEGALRLHRRALVVDTHDDTPRRMVHQGFDHGARDARGDQKADVEKILGGNGLRVLARAEAVAQPLGPSPVTAAARSGR